MHFALSISSMIFKIPEQRIRSSPMIYPEFRLHSIVFASRSLLIMTLLFFARKFDIVLLHNFRGVVVLLTMVLADIVTNSFKDQGKTMRGMPFPEYVSQPMRNWINTFYSTSQIFATAQMIFCIGLDEAFLVLFPIQIAAFLMTCVRFTNKLSICNYIYELKCLLCDGKEKHYHGRSMALLLRGFLGIKLRHLSDD